MKAFYSRSLIVLGSHLVHPRGKRGHATVNVGRTLGTWNGPGEDTDHSSSRDQWATIVSDAVAQSRRVVRADVGVPDSGAVGDGVGQTARGVADGGLLQPLHQVGRVAGVLECGIKVGIIIALAHSSTSHLQP